MRARIILSIALALLVLSSCGAVTPAPTPSPTPTPTPEPTPIPTPTPEPYTKAQLAARADFAEIVEEAVEAIESVRRDELSAVTQPYEGEAEELPEGITQGQREYYEAALDYMAESMPEGLSAYDQYRYLAFVLSLCAEYDYKGRNNSATAYGALIEGYGICLGYSNAMLALCRRANLACKVIRGFARWNNGDHGWNLVMLEEGSYYVDVTWCDQYGDPGTETWQGCFMLTEQRLQEDHGIWQGGPATGTVVYD